MFAGAGPFAITIAKRKKTARIYAIDLNPTAIQYLKKNLKLNNVSNVIPIQGDARLVIADKKIKADRIIMNLPHEAFAFFPDALGAIAGKGAIHYYEIIDRKRISDRIKQLHEVAARHEKAIKIQEQHVVRTYSPREDHISLTIGVINGRGGARLNAGV
jgi:tRNA (guanine37-N1)-methyltransferase